MEKIYVKLTMVVQGKLTAKDVIINKKRQEYPASF